MGIFHWILHNDQTPLQEALDNVLDEMNIIVEVHLRDEEQSHYYDQFVRVATALFTEFEPLFDNVRRDEVFMEQYYLEVVGFDDDQAAIVLLFRRDV